MDGVKSAAVNSTPLSPFMALPDDAIRNIASFCNTSTGGQLCVTCRELHHLLYEELRKAQISLFCRVAECIEKSDVLSDEIRRDRIRCKDHAVGRMEKARSLQNIERISRGFAQAMTRSILSDIVWLEPFASIVNGDVKRGYHFIPPALETRGCQALIDINASHFVHEARLEEAIKSMREGKWDQTEESPKVEVDAKSCVLAGLGKASILLRSMNPPLFLDILERICRKDVREEFLLFCIKSCSQYFVTNGEIFNFLMGETFFFSLSLQTQLQVVEEIYTLDEDAGVRLAIHSREAAVKKKVLKWEINQRMGLILIFRYIRRQVLDTWNSIPIAERKGPVCALIGRLEEICRDYESETVLSSAFWAAELEHVYPSSGDYHTSNLLKLLIKDNRWRIEPPSKMLEESWELLSQFPNLNQGLCAYVLLMHAASCVQ